MKYLILVHSNLAYGMARQVIRHQAWAAEQLVWLTDRHFELPDTAGGDRIDISAWQIAPFRIAEAGRVFSTWSSNLRSIRAIDLQLNAFQKGFILLLPHLRNFKYHALATHPGCRGFYLFEEGKLSYTTGIHWAPGPGFKVRSFLLGIFYRSFVAGRVPPFPVEFPDRHPKYLGAFVTSPLALPGIAEKVIIPHPFVEDPALAHYQRILVIGPYSEFNELPLQVQLQGLEALFRYLISEGVRQLHFKFHPTQLERKISPPPIRELMGKYSASLQFDEIPASVSLENIAAGSEAVFYLATSSTAIYAVSLGRKVYSYANFFVARHPEFRKVVEDIPAVIREQMVFLEL